MFATATRPGHLPADGGWDGTIDGARRLLRRTRIFAEPVEARPAPFAADLDGAAIESLIPHRAPFRLVDRVTAVDLGGFRIRGQRHLRADDPVFRGHFPDDPVYPGVLQLEMVGQLGLCLWGLLARQEHGASDTQRGVDGRVIRLHDATWVRALRPGTDVTIEACSVHHDELTGIVGGQLYDGDLLVATGILEVHFV